MFNENKIKTVKLSKTFPFLSLAWDITCIDSQKMELKIPSLNHYLNKTTVPRILLLEAIFPSLLSHQLPAD